MENLPNNQIIIVAGVIAIWLLSLVFEQSRYFHRKLFRKALYENTVVRTIRNRFLQVFLPGLSGAYFITLDVWGEQWDIIKNHTGKHEEVFTWPPIIVGEIMNAELRFIYPFQTVIKDGQTKTDNR